MYHLLTICLFFFRKLFRKFRNWNFQHIIYDIPNFIEINHEWISGNYRSVFNTAYFHIVYFIRDDFKISS